MAGRVLVVEADPTEASELQTGLAAVGFDVTLMRDGQSGLVRAVTERFDAILVSAELPGMNGIRVCNRIKKDPASRGVPLLMMGTSPEQLDAHRGLATRADGYVRKPAPLGTVVAQLREILGREKPGNVAVADEGDDKRRALAELRYKLAATRAGGRGDPVAAKRPSVATAVPETTSPTTVSTAPTMAPTTAPTRRE